MDQWGQSMKVELDILVESQDIAVKKLMATHGLGLLPAAPTTVTEQLRSGELIKVGSLHGLKEHFHLVTAMRKIENPIAKELMRSFSL